MSTLDLKGKRVLVIGAGRSGVSAARLLVREGAVVVVNDLKGAKALGSTAKELEVLGCELRLGLHDRGCVEGVDLVVLSPGVPPTIEPVVAADRAKIPVLSELELAARFLSTPIVAITGTNGKSTVTELVGRMLGCDHAVFVGGNLGRPATEACDPQSFAWVVLEVSSFQLERSPTFHPRIAAILNITEDHFDRYRTLAEYKAAKLKILGRQGEGDTLVLNRSDPCLEDVTPPSGCRVLYFSLSSTEKADAGLVEDETTGEVFLEWRLPPAPPSRFSLASLKVAGLHNIENALAAGLIARLAGAAAGSVAEVLQTFTGLPHRMQVVGTRDGVTYIDDSKATNVGSAVASLAGFADRQVIWIAGGRDKGGDWSPLIPAVKKKSAMPCFWARPARRWRKLSPRTSPITLPPPSRMRCGWPVARRSPATSFCWRRPVPASICFATMPIAERSLPGRWKRKIKASDPALPVASVRRRRRAIGGRPRNYD